MMKIVTVLLILLTFSCSQKKQHIPTEIPSSNSIYWGMTMEEVKEIEGDDVSNITDNILTRNDVVAGLNAEVGYFFRDNKLLEVNCVFHSADSINYIMLRERLIDKYGTPTKSRMEDNSYRCYIEKDGIAVSVESSFLLDRENRMMTLAFLDLNQWRK